MSVRTWSPLLAALGMAAANAGAADVDLAKALPAPASGFAWQGRTVWCRWWRWKTSNAWCC